MPPFKNVLLIGASGNLGTEMLQAFLRSKYEVTVLSRKDSKSTFPKDVHVLKVDYSHPPSLQTAMTGQDVVISMIGGAVVGDQDKFIDAAVAAGVRRFMPSEFGPDTLNPGVHEIIPTLPAKVSTVNYLKTKESSMEWTSLITGVWLDWALELGLFAFDFKNRVAAIVDGGDTLFTGTILPKVAKAVLAILDRAEETRNTYIYVSSFNITQNDLLQAFEKVDGQKWTVKHENSKDILAQGRKMVQEGNYGGTIHLVRYLVTNTAALGKSPQEELWDEKLGLEPDNLEQVIRDIYRKQ
ncbi:isoflavone reductase [Pyrenochaeta sp. DS3sAY3a]|nr:isoflavone reductase [Pyrenochaeta sp. DS3sAY3a]